MESEIFQMNMKKIQLNSHPYQKNIQQLTFDPDMLLQSFMPLDLFGEDLTCDFIDTISQLRSTIESLANKNVLGIDTEGYSKNVFRPIIGKFLGNLGSARPNPKPDQFYIFLIKSRCYSNIFQRRKLYH